MDQNDRPHERHDRHLIAALAADDLEAAARSDAEELVASCRDCAELMADLRAIAKATAALPPVRRTREFRITAADAARLRPTGWRRVAEALAGARFAFTRPLAIGLATMGLVGLIATNVPAGLGGSSASAPQPGIVDSQFGSPTNSGAGVPASPASNGGAAVDEGSKAGSAASPLAPLPSAKSGSQPPAFGADTGPSAAPSAPPQAAASSSSPERGTGGETAIDTDRGFTQSSGGSSLLLRASLVSLALGVGLLLARWVAGRVVRRS